jgi:hypothetical protein
MTDSTSAPSPESGGGGLRVAGLLSLLALVFAGSVMWLVFTEPQTVAEAIEAGELSPLLETLARSLRDLLLELLGYL